MTCKRCGSNHVKDFDGEVAIQIPEWEGTDKATVMLFPELIVCVRCGVVEFMLPSDKLEQLKNRSQSR
jgi:ribosomal protein L37E